MVKIEISLTLSILAIISKEFFEHFIEKKVCSPSVNLPLMV